MCIPVELLGNERQKIPAVLMKIDKSMGLIKFRPEFAAVRVPLSKLLLAPNAFEKCENVFAHTEIGKTDDITNHHFNRCSAQFSTRDPAEIWLNSEATTREKSNVMDGSENGEPKKDDQIASSFSCALGAWWPGRVLTVQGGFAHVEVAAPLSENDMDDLLGSHVTPHLVRLGSALFPYRSTLVKLDEVRTPWSGKAICQKIVNGTEDAIREFPVEYFTLASPGVLIRHTICIPAYLARLAASVDSHSALVKFCEAPCLVQCDPEPFLSHALAKRILDECDAAVASGRQTPSQTTESETVPHSVAISADSQSSASPSWPSASSIAHSSILNAPNIAGTLSSTGITDPTLLLEGLPGSNGPLVLLHIWSGSAEAIRRSTLLELAHVRILVFRYHIMRKLSNGEPGELDLIDSTASPTENGDAPVMHCRPISIPIHVNSTDVTAADNHAAAKTMIGYTAQFRITPHLVGLAIGHRGTTIQEARALTAVRSVELLRDGTVQVEAETVEACQSVRNLLDFTEAEIPVSPRLASRLIGSKGINIRKLAASAGIRRAQLLDPLMRKRRQQQKKQHLYETLSESLDQNPHLSDDDHQDGDKPNPSEMEHGQNVESHPDRADDDSSEGSLPPPAFYLLGTRQAVAKMRLLLEFQADNWTELDELEETRRNLSSQLRQSAYPGARNSSQMAADNSYDTGVREHPSAFRGRGRISQGRGALTGRISEADPDRRPPNRPPFRGRTRGGMSDAGWPSTREYSDNHPAHASSAEKAPEHETEFREVNGKATKPSSEQGQISSVNGCEQGPEGGRGRGRNRSKVQPVAAV